MFTQLNPLIPLDVEGKGPGMAVGVIDYGADHDLIFVVALAESGEIWCVPNHQVRAQKNITMGRRVKEKPHQTLETLDEIVREALSRAHELG